jgi:hypothetical protein
MRFAHGSFRKGRIFLKLIIGNKGDNLLANTWDAANARIFEKLGASNPHDEHREILENINLHIQKERRFVNADSQTQYSQCRAI